MIQDFATSLATLAPLLSTIEARDKDRHRLIRRARL
jgi:hypothetical protein